MLVTFVAAVSLAEETAPDDFDPPELPGLFSAGLVVAEFTDPLPCLSMSNFPLFA
jgi:hypothetical protein